MEFGLILLKSGLIRKKAVNDIIKCNETTQRFGLVLTQTQAADLVETRTFALSQNGRIEFGGGVIDKIIKEFCDSPYLSMPNYAATVHELVEVFYYYKNETMDLIPDDDLIRYMKVSFDGVCQGSLDLLAGRELDTMAKKVRSGCCFDAAGEWQLRGEEDSDGT